MSKGSLFWSTSRGKLGDVVLSVRNGEQISRKYQPVVKNPRSYSQMLQRVKFAACVKFYGSAMSKFFKFAFQDKKKNESDYNAFIRKNAQYAPIITKAQAGVDDFPVIGNEWILADGSLNPAEVGAGMDRPYFAISQDGLQGYAGDIRYVPISVLSHAILVAYPDLQNGDIVTFVRVWSDADMSCMSWEAEDLVNIQLRWDVAQFYLNDANGQQLDQYFGTSWGHEVSISDEEGKVFFDTGRNLGACGYAVIFSRNTPQGLVASHSTLVLNDAALSMYYASVDTDYTMAALASWGMGGDAVLQGNVANDAGKIVRGEATSMSKFVYGWNFVSDAETSEEICQKIADSDLNAWQIGGGQFKWSRKGEVASGQLQYGGPMWFSRGIEDGQDSQYKQYIVLGTPENIGSNDYMEGDFEAIGLKQTQQGKVQLVKEPLVCDCISAASTGGLKVNGVPASALVLTFTSDMSVQTDRYVVGSTVNIYYKNVYIGSFEVSEATTVEDI